MKNGIKTIIILFVSLMIGIFVDKMFFTNKKEELSTEKSFQKKNTRILSMMLETGAYTGVYETTMRSTWPTDGYLFNSSLSKCENGGKLSWDEENNTVVMTGSTSDKCYVYFDKVVYLAEYIRSLYTVQGSNGLYLHNSSLVNGAGDNSYRYAGEEPNNFVCFGSDAATCPDDNLYRIIGVFGSHVKLIKSSLATSAMLGTNGSYRSNTEYYWNNSTNTNIWSASNLNTVNLNTNYITYLNNQNTKWARKIAETTWKVEGNTLSNIPYVTPQNSYQNEIVSPAANTTYNSKIGLMYVSDYGYAASPSAWTTKLRYYNNVTNENWMYGSAEWTITRNSDSSYYAFCVISTGHVNYDNVYDSSSQYYDNYGVRPCFYLNSDVEYVSGTGEKSSPIRIN